MDTATTPYVDWLPWSAFTRLVEAKIIEVDPTAAEARRAAAAMAWFVATGRSTEHGLKTLVARAGAGEVTYFVAVCDRIAQILRLDGDPTASPIRPVLDLRGQVPVNAYEVPHEMREALRLARPTSIYPWSRAGTRPPDSDHTIAYLPIEKGGPPGQTRIGNIGPMIRSRRTRVKTHGAGW